MELADELERLASLHEAGSLTDDEFAAAKRRLLEHGAVTLPASAPANSSAAASDREGRRTLGPAISPDGGHPEAIAVPPRIEPRAPMSAAAGVPATDGGQVDHGRVERGWYVDPVHGSDWERFWLGTNWTARVRRKWHTDESSSPMHGRKLDPPRPETRRPDRPERTAARPGERATTVSTRPAPLPASSATNGLAIASLVLGIIWLYWLGSLLAIVFGHVARTQIRESRGAQTGDGLAVAGLVLGYVGVAILLLVLIVAAGA